MSGLQGKRLHDTRASSVVILVPLHCCALFLVILGDMTMVDG